jgi:hypothetical protein
MRRASRVYERFPEGGADALRQVETTELVAREFPFQLDRNAGDVVGVDAYPYKPVCFTDVMLLGQRGCKPPSGT